MTGALLSALLLMAFALAPKARAADCVDDAKWKAVAGYYDSNKAKSPNYGANWYRVLIAYRGEDPERALPTWAGATAKPTAPFTVKEAEAEEAIWSGWTPVRKALQCLNPPRLPDAAAPSVLINAIADGDEGTTASLSATLSGGNYDGPPEYAWTVSMGALDDATSPTPTWTRPAVDSDASIVVSLALTVRGSGTNARSGTSATANAGASVLVRDSPPPPPPPSDPAPSPSSCVGDEQWDTVAGYYNSNRSKSPNYGANWYRVLIAYQGEDPERALPTWTGATAKPTTAYTVKEAEDGEKVWSGWAPVRKVLECLNPPQPQRSSQQGSQDQQITTYTVTVPMPAEIQEGATGSPTFHFKPKISPAAPHHIKLRVKAPNSAGTARPTNFSNGNPVWSDGSANPNWDYALFSGKFNVGFILNINTGKSSTAESLGISIHSDDVYEGDETIGLEVSCEAGCGGGAGDNYVVDVVNDPSPTVIKDDDPKPHTFALSANNVTEGDPIKVKITADRPAQDAYGMNLIIADNETRSGRPDKKAVKDETKTITMPAYETEVSLDLPTFVHSDIEHRIVNLTLRAPTLHDRRNLVAKGLSVLDQLDVYLVRVDTPNGVSEGNGTGNRVFQATISLDRALGRDLTLTAKRANRGNAKGVSLQCIANARVPPTEDAVDWDYGFCGNINGHEITLTAGTTSKTLDIVIHEDDTYEDGELISFEVTCDVVSGNTNGCGDGLYKVNLHHNSSFLTQIINDDPKPDLSVTSGRVVEGEDVVFTVTADRKAQKPYDFYVRLSDPDLVNRRLTFTMPAYATQRVFREPTTNDAAYRQRVWSALLERSPGYSYTANTIGRGVSAYALDTIKPIVSTSAATIEEGEDLVVTVSADRPHILDYQVAIELRKNSGPDNILEFGLDSSRKLTMKAGETSVEATYQTRGNNRRDGDVDGFARITKPRNNPNNSLWEKGREASFTITDSGHSNIPIIGFKSLVNQQGKSYVCANTTNAALFDEGSEDGDGFECNLSINGPPNPEFTLKYEVVHPYPAPKRDDIYPYSNRKSNNQVGVSLDSNPSRFSLTIHSSTLSEHGAVDQGDSYPVTIRLLPSDQYDLTDFDETYIELDDNEDFFAANAVSADLRLYDSGDIFRPIIFTDLDDLLGEILEIGVTFSTTYHKSASLVVCAVALTGDVRDFFDSENLDEEECLKEQFTLFPWARHKVIRVPLRSTRFDRDVEYDPETGISSGYVRVVVKIACPDNHLGTCIQSGGGADISYQIYPPPQPSTLDPDDPNHVVNPHEYGARQCVEKNIPRDMTCGEGGRKVIIEMPADEIIEGAGDGYAYLYPSSGLPEKVKVRVTRKDKNSNDVQKTDIDVPPTGLKHNLGLNNDKDERDREFEYSFQVVGGTTWQIHPDNAKKSIKVIDDEPTVFDWTTNTLTNIADEGGFPKIAKMALRKQPNGHAGVGSTDATHNDFWQAQDVVTWDFNLGGSISLKDAIPENCLNASDKVACNKLPSQDPSGVAETVMPVHIDFDNSATNEKVTRTGLDSFEETGRTSAGNGWTMTIAVGEDSNTVDEDMTVDIQINLSQSGGGAVFADSPPSAFKIYDDDGSSGVTVDDPDFDDDNVYVSFTLDKYQVSERAGPAQPVIQYYNKDNNGDAVEICARKNESNCKRSTTLKDTARIFVNVETTGTATRGDFSLHQRTDDKVSDFYVAAKPDLLLIPGWDVSSAKFDIRINGYDDDHVDVYKAWIANGRPGTEDPSYDPSGDETINLSIDAASLPTGILVDPDGHSSSTVTIVNNEQDVVDRENAQAQANKCTLGHEDYDANADCNKPMIEITKLSRTNFNDTSAGVSHMTFKNKNSTHGLNNKRIKYNVQGPCIRSSGSLDLQTKTAVTLAAEATMQERLDVTTSSYGGRRPILRQGSFTNTDDLDCNVNVSLRPSSDYIIAGGSKSFVIKDTHATSVYMNSGRKADAHASFEIDDHSEDRPLSMAIFLRKATKNSSGTVIGGTNRRLVAGEVLDVPIKARLSGSSTELTTDDFLISAFENQSNLAIKELPGKAGYSVRMRHVPSAPATNCHSNTAGTANNINHVACLSLSTTMDLEDETEQSIDVYVDYADGNFGDTNLSGGFANLSGDGTQSSSVTFNVKGFGSEVGNQYGAQADAKTLTLYVKQREVEEPEPNEGPSLARDQNWIDIPLDVVMNPGPSSYEDTSYTPPITRNRATRFHFCVEKTGTTASYYHDWRIVHELEHIHDEAVGGYAWDSKEGCTKKDGIFTHEIKKRFYLRVHGDHVAENDETIALKLKIESSNDNVDNVTADGTPTTVTIKDEADGATKSASAKRAAAPSSAGEARDASPAGRMAAADSIVESNAGGPRWSFQQSWYEGGTHFWDGEGFDESGTQNALYAMLEIGLVTAHDPAAAIPYGEADRGVCLDPAEVPSRLEFEGFSLRPLKWRDAPDPYLCRSFLDFENNGSWLADDGLLVNEWGMYVRLGIVDDDEANGDEETPAGFPFILDNPAFPVDVDGGTLDMDTFIILDDDDAGPQRVF